MSHTTKQYVNNKISRLIYVKVCGVTGGSNESCRSSSCSRCKYSEGSSGVEGIDQMSWRDAVESIGRRSRGAVRAVVA